MTDAAPVLASQPKSKHASIRAKILLALLLLSLLPLILFVALSLYGITNAEGYLRTELIRESQKDMVRLVKMQAAAANAMLDKIRAETQMTAISADALLRNPSASGHTRSYSVAEKPEDPTRASKYLLAPGLSLAAAQPVLDLTSNLDELFYLVRNGDPNVERVYIAMEAGVIRAVPWDDDSLEKLEFRLDSTAAPPDDGGSLPEPLRQAFKRNGFDLSRHALVRMTDPGNQWVISDDQSDRVFSLRREETGLVVYRGHDERTRPWYREAFGQNGVTWSKYATQGKGKLMFSLPKELESQIGDKVSSSLMQEFAREKLALAVGSPISVVGPSKWTLRDKNENNYEIEEADGQLNVYDLDDLTASRAVLDPDGHLAGVLGLDINMDSIRKRIIRTPDEVDGYAFLLNDKGEVIDQEQPNMFIPPAGGAIRSKMAAGEVGHVYDAANATHVFYAPIPSIHSADAKSVWSLGISVPEAAITRLAKDTQRRLFFVLEMGVLLFFVVMPLPMIFAAIRTSRGIAKPIVQLEEGVERIGSGNLDYRLNVKTNDEIGALANAFNKMTGDLQTYVKDLERTTAEKERFESELRVAHDIQMSFLKKIFPPFPHRDDFSLYAEIKPAREVGGDLYDFALLDDSRLFFYIGDVSDKGVPASLIMAMTMTLMKRASLQPGLTPAGILSQVNVTLSEGNESVMFVTLFIGILNLGTGELAFSNAGHNPPVILTADGDCEYLTLPDGMVLGVMPEAQYSDVTVVLESGATIVIYTDGVTEAMNPTKELYSERRLQETVAELKGRSVEDTVAAIFASVKAHAVGAPQSDDIAVLAVRRN